jgi:hypothetical protein
MTDQDKELINRNLDNYIAGSDQVFSYLEQLAFGFQKMSAQFSAMGIEPSSVDDETNRKVRVAAGYNAIIKLSLSMIKSSRTKMKEK